MEAFANAINSVANNAYFTRARDLFDKNSLGHKPGGATEYTGDGGPLWSDQSAPLADALLRQLVQIHLQVGVACHPQPLEG